jgi:hypothetical protein
MWLTGVFIAAAAARAQTPESFCFRGRPLKRCHAFAIFEGTLAKRVVGTSRSEPLFTDSNTRIRIDELPSHVSWNLGAMVNRDSSHAIGGMFELGVADPGWRVAIKARRRVWTPEGDSFDLSAGPIVLQETTHIAGTANAYGITADAAIGTSDVLGVTLGTDVVWLSSGRPRAAIHGGLRLGSYATVAATTVYIAGAALIASTFGHNDF